jgi:hypothetical protein
MRKNKAMLENHLIKCDKKINFALIYQLNERIPYLELERKLLIAINKLISEINDEK